MEHFDSEQLTEQAFERLNESARRDPRICPWGLFAWGDAPPACGGGVGAFQWYESIEELIEFITDWSAAGYMTFDDEAEWLEQRQCLRAIASQWHANPETTIQNLNTELKGLLQIDWIGTFAQLKAANDAFASRIQEAFNEDQVSVLNANSDSFSGEDTRKAEDAFIKYLSEYGM